MATCTWIGTNATNVGDWGTPANWSGAAVPINADDVRFTSGSQDVTSGLDQSAVTVASFVRDSGYTGRIGRSGSYLQLGVSGKAYWRGNGLGYMDFGAGAGNLKVVNTGNTSAYFKGNVALTLLQAGTVDWSTGTVTLMLVEHTTAPGGVKLTINTPTFTTMRTTGGVIEMIAAGTVSTLHQVGGAFDVQEGTVTTDNIYGGTQLWKTDQTVTNVYAWGGSFDASGDARAKTISNIEMHAGSVVNLDAPGEAITLSNNLVYYGGTLIWEKYRTLGFI